MQQARTIVAAEKARVDEQRTKGYAAPTQDSFATLLPRYFKHQKPRPSQRSYERTSGIVENQLRPAFGAMPMGSIRRSEIQDYITQRTGEVSAGSITKELNVLKHILGLAVEWELIPFNQALKVKAPRVPAGRVRYLQPTELRALLAACPEWLRPVAALAAFTAMRRGEILSLRWLDVDLNGGRVLLPQTKNGDGRVIYLNQLAAQVVRSQWTGGARPTDRVFSEDFHFHDLRHTAASWLRMQGRKAGFNLRRVPTGDCLNARKKAKMSTSLGASVPTASPGFWTTGLINREVIDLIGSVNGDRTRTLRLERAAC